MLNLPLRKYLSSSLATAAAAVAFAAPLAAQGTASQAVVQPLPSQDVQRLNRALMRLAKRPRSVDALVEAGDAALAVDDLDAAIGFYSRAEDIEPSNERMKLGMARVFLRSGRPVDALPLFAAAQASGTDADELLSDRALAFDLIGDQPSAQAAYRRAIKLRPRDDEARRRLALSLAISGDREGFEQMLRPLLEKRDFASFRARAFGLAILGDHARAAAIAGAVMPRDLAARIDPYFEFMPRLTRSQQAAAANLGIFPRAADIGREDPQIAAYTSAAPAPAPQALARAEPVAPAPVRSADTRLAPAGEPLGPPPRAVAEAQPTQPVSQPAVAVATPAPGFDLARTTQAARPVPVGPTSVAAPAQPPAAPSVADAFADIGTADPAAARKSSAEAVNLAAIDIPREVEAPPKPEAKPEPAKPAHPSRIWVQLATGRDVSALKFDWRRFSRKAPALLGDLEPHVTPWGEANRLLAGPLPNRTAQRDLINALKDEGIDTFGYSSPQGTEITPLK